MTKFDRLKNWKRMKLKKPLIFKINYNKKGIRKERPKSI